MKYRFGSIAGSLGCIAFLVVACGGASFEGTDGTSGAASGGNSAGSGGNASAGSSSGGSASAGRGSAGTASGGSASGGSASGGSANGGSASGGVTHGGTGSGGASGGVSSGGAGGDPLACKENADCVACAFPTAPQTAADCYCASCAGAAMSKTACAANKAAWEKSCSAMPMICPAIACVQPPVPECKSNVCVGTR